MYQHNQLPFGAFQKHTLSHTASGASFSIVPAHSATVVSLVFKGKNILDAYDTPEALVAGDWAKNVFLFPFPNRLRDGRYTHLGQTYQFDINNADTQNAIHGFFGQPCPFEVTAVVLEADFGALHCRFVHDGSHAAYPFKFAIDIQFILRGASFEIDMRCTNLDTVPIPMGLGWHPYFRLAEKSDAVALQMPALAQIEIDDRMLPTGQKSVYTAFEHLTTIGETVLDNGFYIENQGQDTVLTLASDFGTLEYWQETGPQKWNFVQVFTPPHRLSVAIEPMTCNIDAFNNGDGLVVLAPDAAFGGRFGVRFEG